MFRFFFGGGGGETIFKDPNIQVRLRQLSSPSIHYYIIFPGPEGWDFHYEQKRNKS